MTKKLTPTMQKAMDALPLKYTTWGLQTWSQNFPDGVTMKTINALHARGLVKIIRGASYGDKVVVKK